MAVVRDHEPVIHETFLGCGLCAIGTRVRFYLCAKEQSAGHEELDIRFGA